MAAPNIINKVNIVKRDATSAIKFLQKLKPRMIRAVEKANSEFAQKLLQEMQQYIRDGRAEWKALSNITIKLKGHSRPLYERGLLLNSLGVVTSKPRTSGGISQQFIRVGSFDKVSASYPDGRTPSRVAKLMEKGFEFTVTEEISASLAARGVNLAVGTRITVPARPFLAPAQEKLDGTYKSSTRETLKRELGPLVRDF